MANREEGKLFTTARLKERSSASAILTTVTSGALMFAGVPAELAMGMAASLSIFISDNWFGSSES